MKEKTPDKKNRKHDNTKDRQIYHQEHLQWAIFLCSQIDQQAYKILLLKTSVSRYLVIKWSLKQMPG
jgi:hypothetical protein